MANADGLRAHFDLTDQVIADANKEEVAETARLSPTGRLKPIPLHTSACWHQL